MRGVTPPWYCDKGEPNAPQSELPISSCLSVSAGCSKRESLADSCWLWPAFREFALGGSLGGRRESLPPRLCHPALALHGGPWLRGPSRAVGVVSQIAIMINQNPPNHMTCAEDRIGLAARVSIGVRPGMYRRVRHLGSSLRAPATPKGRSGCFPLGVPRQRCRRDLGGKPSAKPIPTPANKPRSGTMPSVTHSFE